MNRRERTFVVLCFSTLDINPRERRQIEVLRERGRVIACGLTDPGLEGVEFEPVIRRPVVRWGDKMSQAALLLARRYEFYLSRRFTIGPGLARISPSLVCAHNIQTMPLAHRLARGAPIILDLHEYHPRELESSALWKICFKSNLQRLCEKWLPRASICYSVGEGLAAEYKKNFHIDCGVIYSASPWKDLRPSPVDPEHIHIEHHGVANRDRKIENMIAVMRHTDLRFTLHITLLGGGAYIAELKGLSANMPNIVWHEPVPADKVPEAINSYDLGIVLYPDGDFNLDYCMPNKFFECTQARLAIAVGRSPEMAAMIRRFDLGLVSGDDSPEALAAALNALSAADIIRFKNNAHKAAAELCAEKEQAKFARLVDGLLEEKR